MESLWQDKQFDTIFREIRTCFKIWLMWNSQGQWLPYWKCQNIWHISKVLFMLLLNSVQSLTILTFCAQWICLGALLDLQTRYCTKGVTGWFVLDCHNFGLSWLGPMRAATNMTKAVFERIHRSNYWFLICNNHLTMLLPVNSPYKMPD